MITKTRNADGTVTEMKTIGAAQKAGYVNRRSYRHEVRELNRAKSKNTNKEQIPEYQIMGGARMNGAPVYIPRRKKLKYYQKK